MRVSWLTEPDAGWDEEEPTPRRNRLKLAAAALAGWLAVSLIVLVGLLRFADRDAADRPVGARGPAATAPAATPTAPSGPAGSGPAGSGSAPAPASSSTAAGRLPDRWLVRVADRQRNCTAHSYGQVQVFFARTPCSSVQRRLLSTEHGGRDIVVATSTVTFDSQHEATTYLRLVTSDGTGNINDLLREGSRYPGSPSKLPATAFASRQDGSRVLVAEAGFVDGESGYQDPILQATARRAVQAG